MNTLALRLACVLTLGLPTLASAGDPPPAPASLIASSVGNTGRVEIHWADSAAETGYRIRREPAWSDGVIELPADTTGFYDQSGRGTFTYFVWAFNEWGESPVSELGPLTVRRGNAGPHGIRTGSTSSGGTPTAPRRLRAAGGSGSVRLDWQDRSSNESGFDIQRQTQDGLLWRSESGFQVVANQTTFEQAVDPGVYRYRVRAINALGASGYTDWVIASVSGTGGGTQPPAGMPPAAPSGLSVSDAGDGRAMLSWTDNSDNETEFRAERDPASASGTISVGANTTTFIDAAGNGTFRYRVCAVNSYGVSPFTAWV